MSAALEHTGGHYAQFFGDGLMALYEFDTNICDGESKALREAVEMSNRMAQINARLEGELSEPLRVEIGIRCGAAIGGFMGPPNAVNFSALSDNVNVAARLEAETKALDCTLVISVATPAAAAIDFADLPIHEAEPRRAANQCEHMPLRTRRICKPAASSALTTCTPAERHSLGWREVMPLKRCTNPPITRRESD
jgi:adenylate cyclase